MILKFFKNRILKNGKRFSKDTKQAALELALYTVASFSDDFDFSDDEAEEMIQLATKFAESIRKDFNLRITRG